MLGLRRAATVSGTRDQRIAVIADLQRGHVSRQQLLAAGVGANAIDRLVRCGRLVRVHRGVYAEGHRRSIPLADETAALLACREGAVLSHETAAVIWGLRGASSADGRIHVLLPGLGSGAQLEGVITRRTARLDGADIRIRTGLPVTSPARTVLDLAPILSNRALELALDQALVRRLISRSEREQLRGRCVGRPGCGHLAWLLEAEDRPTTITRSEAEEQFLKLIRRADLPAPQVNIRADGKERDFRWPAQRLLVEVDGWSSHRTRQAFENDRRRDAKAGAAGWTTMRITYRQLVDEPLAVVARVAAALARLTPTG